MRELARLALIVAACALLAPPAFADYGRTPPPPPASGGSSSEPSREPGVALTPRQQADVSYRDAYNDVAKATAELEQGKKDSAIKKLKRALERSRRAVELDSTYTEAWNLVGFTSRKLGDYPAAFAAYRTAIRQNPRYAQAREYYGQGLLEQGDLAGAREQLGWLRRIGDTALQAQLQSSIDKYEAARVAPVADSTASHSGGR